MPILTNEEIQKKFKLHPNDAKEIEELQAMGVDYGRRGVSVDSEEFEDDAAFDIEHLAILLDIEETQLLRLFKQAMAEGAKTPKVATGAPELRAPDTEGETVAKWLGASHRTG